MERIETNNFTLTRNIIDANGDSTWVVTQKRNKAIFYIHVFSTNYINIKFFPKTTIKNAEEAISALCNFLVKESLITPSINIYYKNTDLIITCRRAGFRKVKNVKHLYTFKVKSTS